MKERDWPEYVIRKRQRLLCDYNENVLFPQESVCLVANLDLRLGRECVGFARSLCRVHIPYPG